MTIDEDSLEREQKERKAFIKKCDKILERAHKIRDRHQTRMFYVQKKIDKLTRVKGKVEAYMAQAALKLEVGKIYIEVHWNDTGLFYVDRLTKTGLPVGRHIRQMKSNDGDPPFRLFEVAVKMLNRSEMRYCHRDNKIYEGSPLTALVTQGVILDRFLEMTSPMKRQSTGQYILQQKDGTLIDVTDVKVTTTNRWSSGPLSISIRDVVYQCDKEHYEDVLDQLREQGLNV